MALTGAQLVGEVAAILHMDSTSGSEDATSILRALNWAGRYIWTSRPWPERRIETVITTVAPYSTGTATFTNASTTLSGSGTTWTGFSGRKAALGFNAPFYRVSSVGGATSITLARAYLEDTASGTTYVIYQDEYDTTSSFEVIESATLLLTATQGPLLNVAESRLDAEATIQTTSGKPHTVAICSPTTSGTPRLKVLPVPDDEYAILVKGWKAWTDLAGAGETPVLDANKESLLVEGACLFAQRPSDNRMQSSYGQLEELISIYWAKSQNMAPISFRRRRFDERGSADFVYLNVT